MTVTALFRRAACSVAAGTLLACADPGADADAARAPSTQADAPPSSGMAAPVRRPGAPDTLSGVVLERLPVGPYVYTRLNTATDGEVWAAVNAPADNEPPITVGMRLTVYNAMVMQNFASPTLGRTFERIWFGLRSPVASAPASPSPDVGMSSPGTPVAASANVGSIARATGPNARTIGELYAERQAFAGRAATVRGVVVKYNGGVMGRNWLHLQDGSGQVSAGTGDLTVTSLDSAALGDTVTVSGTVQLNRDFGAGYTYPLVLESAKVTRRSLR